MTATENAASKPHPNEETEITGVRGVDRSPFGGGPGPLQDVLLVVSGPDGDDEICLLAASECYLSREAAERLIVELQRRLQR